MESIVLYLSLVCWVIFYIYWCISAFAVKKTGKRESVAGLLIYRLPTIIGVSLVIYGRDFPSFFSQLVVSKGVLASAIAAAMSIVGLVISIWARVTLGRNWSSLVVIKVGHELIQTGPYQFVRHPIYTGIILMFGANVLLAGRVASFVGGACSSSVLC